MWCLPISNKVWSLSVVIVGIIRWKPVLTHASIICGGMLALVNSVNICYQLKWLHASFVHALYILACLQSQQLTASVSMKFLDGNTTVWIILSPVNIRNTSMLVCLDTPVPVPICLTDSSALVNYLGSECLYTVKNITTRNVGQCQTWWPSCRI